MLTVFFIVLGKWINVWPYLTKIEIKTIIYYFYYLFLFVLLNYPIKLILHFIYKTVSYTDSMRETTNESY